MTARCYLGLCVGVGAGGPDSKGDDGYLRYSYLHIVTVETRHSTGAFYHLRAIQATNLKPRTGFGAHN